MHQIGNTTVLCVSPYPADGALLERILNYTNSKSRLNLEWTLISTANLASALSVLRESAIPIVFCDCDLAPGTWREMLDRISHLSDPPLLVVTSRVADTRLWAEALSLGAYDVLTKPYDTTEVIRTLGLAWQHWLRRQSLRSDQIEEASKAVT